MSVVALNIYDLLSSEIDIPKWNSVTLPFGFGAFHTGLEIFGWEISFGVISGIHWLQTRKATGALFRKCIKLGTTDYSVSELSGILEEMRQKYKAENYHILNLNCNHFTSELCVRLVGSQRVPTYINKLAKFGAFITLFSPNMRTWVENMGKPVKPDDNIVITERERRISRSRSRDRRSYQNSARGEGEENNGKEKIGDSDVEETKQNKSLSIRPRNAEDKRRNRKVHSRCVSDLYMGYSDPSEQQKVSESLQNVKTVFGEDNIVIKRKGIEDDKEEKEMSFLELIREDNNQSKESKQVLDKPTGDQVSFLDFLREDNGTNKKIDTETTTKIDSNLKQDFKSATSPRQEPEKLSFLEFLRDEPKKKDTSPPLKKDPSTTNKKEKDMSFLEFLREEPQKKTKSSPSVSPPVRPKHTGRTSPVPEKNTSPVPEKNTSPVPERNITSAEKFSMIEFLREEQKKDAPIQRMNTAPEKTDTSRSIQIVHKKPDEKLPVKEDPPKEEEKLSFYEFLREPPPVKQKSKDVKKTKSKERPELKKSMTSTDRGLKEKYSEPKVPKLVTTKVDTKSTQSQPKTERTNTTIEEEEVDFFEFLRQEKNRKKNEPVSQEKGTRSKKLKHKDSKKVIEKSPEKGNGIDKGVGNQLVLLGKFILDEPKKTKTRRTLPKRSSLKEDTPKQNNFQEFYETNKSQIHITPEEDMEEENWIGFLRSTNEAHTKGVDPKENSTSKSETSLISFLLDIDEEDEKKKDSVIQLLEMDKSVGQSTEIFQFLQKAVEQPDQAEVVRTLSRILPTFDV